jgi:hypothetical protein
LRGDIGKSQVHLGAVNLVVRGALIKVDDGVK